MAGALGMLLGGFTAQKGAPNFLMAVVAAGGGAAPFGSSQFKMSLTGS